jgi:hypothetical protein
MKKTLQELNTESVFEWSNYTIAREYRVGRRGRQGSEIHLLRVWRVMADSAPAPRRFQVGGYASISPLCNGNGQFTGSVVENLDTDSVTCQRCLAHSARLR